MNNMLDKLINTRLVECYMGLLDNESKRQIKKHKRLQKQWVQEYMLVCQRMFLTLQYEDKCSYDFIIQFEKLTEKANLALNQLTKGRHAKIKKGNKG